MKETKNCEILEKILILQGDVARYLLEIDDSVTCESFAKRCYMQAMAVNPKSSQSLCQLGTLMSSKNFRIDSIYWYFRALHVHSECSKAKINLDRILAKNARLYKESSAISVATAMQPRDYLELHCKKFCSSLIYVLGLIAFKKEAEMPTDVEICRCCENTLSEFSEISKFMWSAFQYNPYFLNDTIIFNSVIICIVTVDYLKKLKSGKLEIVLGFVLCYFSKIVQLMILRLDYFFSSVTAKAGIASKSNEKSGDKNALLGVVKLSSTLNEGGSKKFKKRTRRRRRVARMSPDVLSEDEDELNTRLSNSDSKEGENDSMTSSNDEASDWSGENDSESSVGNNGDTSQTEVRNKESEVELKMENDSKPVEISDTNQVPAESPVSETEKKLPSLQNFETAKSLTSINEIKILVESLVRNFHLSDSIKQQLAKAFEDTEFLAPLKVIIDWLNEDNNIKKQLPKFSLVHFIVALSNRVDIKNLFAQNDLNIFEGKYKTTPLVEDYALRNVNFLPKRFKNLNWNHSEISENEETFMRVALIYDFVERISKDDDFAITKELATAEFASSHEIKHDEYSRFILSLGIDLNVKEQLSPSLRGEDSEKEKRKLKMMESMGQLRLKSEVERLKKEVEQISSNLPFVIPEAYCFTNRLDAIRKLAESKKVIIIVSKTALNCLDSMKKDHPSAREAIKFLENALSVSNTCVRAQKDYEYSLVDLSSVNFNWKRNRKLVSLCDMLSCANYFVQAPTSSEITEVKQATILFENQPDPSNMGIILSSLGAESPIGYDILDHFCRKFFNK